MKVYLATWLEEPAQGKSLTKCGGIRRLLSYFHLLKKADQFKRYVKTGKNS